MVEHLASLADKRLIISFAPYTVQYAILKRIGELFPGPSKVHHPGTVICICIALCAGVVVVVLQRCAVRQTGCRVPDTRQSVERRNRSEAWPRKLLSCLCSCPAPTLKARDMAHL